MSGITSKVALALAPIILVLAPVDNRLSVQSESRIWVEGTSTVRSFKCSAEVIDGEIATNSPDAASAVFAGEKAVTRVALRIPAAKLDCRNGTMNDHMRKAIKAKEAPVIAFELGSYDLLETNTTLQAKMAGRLTVGGTTRNVTIDADLVREAPGVVRVKGSYDLRMTEFGLTAPTLMLGTMKVNELVKVNFDLLLKG